MSITPGDSPRASSLRLSGARPTTGTGLLATLSMIPPLVRERCSAWGSAIVVPSQGAVVLRTTAPEDNRGPPGLLRDARSALSPVIWVGVVGVGRHRGGISARGSARRRPPLGEGCPLSERRTTVDTVLSPLMRTGLPVLFRNGSRVGARFLDIVAIRRPEVPLWT